MKTTLKTAFGASALLVLLGGASLLPAPASAGEHQSYLGDGAPAILQEVRRRIYVAPGYDPYYAGRAYYAPPVAAYGPPVPYSPPVAYDYAPPVDYDYVPAPGPGVAFVAPDADIDVGY
jgi:hypothetical protein